MEQQAPLQISFEDLSYTVRVRAQVGPSGGGLLGRLKTIGSKTRYDDKIILNRITGTFRPGRVTAILGPSGSGKTTLLNLLAGYESSGTVGGKIWVNGRPASGASIRQLAGYVNQDDVILPTQTVGEAITMSIVLRPPPLSSMPPNSAEAAAESRQKHAEKSTEQNSGDNNAETDAEASPLPLPVTIGGRAPPKSSVDTKTEQRCTHAIRLFGLEKCQHTIIGDSSAKAVSGGERKRTAIAMENVTQPPILLLDEPSSGLDSHSALMVMHQLKAVANEGRTVAAVLHQPSSEMFELIDDILILFEGRLVYMGERAGFVDYLAQLGHPCGMYSNPADHVFNSVLYDHRLTKHMGSQAGAGERAEWLAGAWQASPEARQLQRLVDRPELCPISALQFRRTSSFQVQVRYLAKRAARNAVRNQLIIRIRLAQSIILGLLIGLIFLNTQNRPVSVQRQNFSGALFFTSVTQMLLAMLSVVNVFSQERLVFLREWQSGYYGLPAYFVSKNLVELPIQVVLPIVYSAIAYWLLGLRSDGTKFVLFTVVCVCMNLCGYSFGLLLASALPDMSTILAALPAVFLPFLLFGGLLVNTGNSTVWLRWLQWISPVKYSYSALSVNQFSGYVVDGQPVGDQYLDEINLGPFSTGENIAFIITITVIAWVSAYLALLYLTNKGRGKMVNATKRLQEELLGPPDQRFAQPNAAS
ncbi:hypothetical protein H4S01_002568 [Coemansia sp. RSA 2610]|nr:hypothetical protein H4S01_002568 [Coemansia sp. RSA 2610]